MMTVAAVAAKLASLTVDARVRASAHIVYANSGVEISHGSKGKILAVMHGGALVAVLWDGMREAIWTAFEGVELAPSLEVN